MKTALVTGASRGIGAACAKALAARGWAVCINYVEQKEKAEAVAAAIREQGGVCMCYQADVADAEAVKAMVVACERELGPVSLLVNNAGIAEQHLFQDISPEWFQRILAVNLGGCFNCTQAVLGHMLHEHSGCIVNISSIWGQHGGSCESAYSTTKHAIIGLTRSLAAELAPSHIRVNAIAPGVIDTDMVQVLGRETLDDLEQNVIPMGRMGRPEEIAKAVVFLAEEASYTTGQVLGCDGGFFT